MGADQNNELTFFASSPFFTFLHPGMSNFISLPRMPASPSAGTEVPDGAFGNFEASNSVC